MVSRCTNRYIRTYTYIYGAALYIVGCAIKELVALEKASSFKIVSPDTDVILLSVFFLVTSSVQIDVLFELISNKGSEVLSVNTIVENLGREKSTTLLGFYVLTGCDHIGRFNGITKKRSYKTFIQLPDQGLSIQALSSLGSTEVLSQETIEGLTTYVIKIYCSKWKETENRYKDQTDIGQLRWDFYSKQRTDGDLLPPTPDALKFKLLRSNFIALVWKQKLPHFLLIFQV